MEKLYLIHTVGNYKDLISDPFSKPFADKHPELEIFNISDDSLLKETLLAGKVTSNVAAKILSYARCAEISGAGVVMVTCTSVNEVAQYARRFLSIPVFNIDEPVAKMAVASGTKIGILATLPTSPIGTERLLMQEAENQGKKIETVIKVAEGAFDVLCSGDRTKHDEMVNEQLFKLSKEVDVLVFAQISMSLVKHEKTDIPLYKIGESGFEHAAELLGLNIAQDIS